MWAERVLWKFAVAGGILVALGSCSPRTMRIYGEPPGFTIATESIGWHGLAFLSGVAAMIALAIGLHTRPRVPVAVLSALATAVALGFTALKAGQEWVNLTKEGVQAEGYALRAAPGLPYVTVVAIAGAGFALALAVSWLRPADEEGTDRRRP